MRSSNYRSGQSARRSGSPAVMLCGISLSALAMVLAGVAPVRAATYSVSTEAQLRQALIDANADGDAGATINLAGNILVLDPTGFDQATKPISIDTNGFSLAGDVGVGITGAGISPTFLGGLITIKGAVNGGSAALVNSRGSGGNGVTISDGVLNNDGAVIGELAAIRSIKAARGAFQAPAARASRRRTCSS